LKSNEFDKPDLVFVQSFEVDSLKKLNELTDVHLIQLIGELADIPYDLKVAGQGATYRDMLEDSGLRQIKSYADGIGPWKGQILGEDENSSFDPTLVNRAHAAGLKVHPYTFR